jgi:hypothetical protein
MVYSHIGWHKETVKMNGSIDFNALLYAVQNISKRDYKKIYSVPLHRKIFSILIMPGSLDSSVGTAMGYGLEFDSRQRQSIASISAPGHIQPPIQ